MSAKNHTGRRSFLQRTAFGAGVAVLASGGRRAAARNLAPKSERLPREVWVASIAQNGMRAGDHQQMMAMVLSRMEEVAAFQPDIVCLPEIFPFVSIAGGSPPIADVAEDPIDAVSEPFADFAKKHHCYVVCPIFTKANGHYYNSAVFIDRNGEPMGEYRKMHPTVGEMNNGVTAGPLDPPVFRTDFGVVGAQICFDIEWTDGWQKLQEAGAEIVFWPSAYAGGATVNAKAWQHKYCVVTSTNKDTTKICDVSGEEVARTTRWNRTICAPVNLEKAFLHTWPYVRRFGDIHAKYGRKVRIKTFADEEWTIIESRSPDVHIADVLEEFELKTHVQHLQMADEQQCACRV